MVDDVSGICGAAGAFKTFGIGFAFVFNGSKSFRSNDVFESNSIRFVVILSSFYKKRNEIT